MKYRVLSFALAAALGCSLAAPASAQHMSDGYSFLKAVKDNDADKVTEIIDKTHGRIVDTRDASDGKTALHIVVEQRNAPYIRYLLAKGADPNARDDAGETAAMLAVQSDYGAAIDILQRYHADFNVANNRGETPLIRAVQMRNAAMVRALLDSGANPDQRDTIAGMSARDYAERDGRSPAILDMLEDAPKQEQKAQAFGPHL